MAQALFQGAIGGPRRDGPPGTPSDFSPPKLTVEIKALACQLPATLGLPLLRLSVADVARHAQRTGLVARISDSTVWRWLHEDACGARIHVRGGAWAYLAALDVHRAKVFGRCEATTGIAPFERLVDQVMSQPPYSTARRVFWVMDNGSSHRGQASVRRLTQAHPTLVPVHGPVHASWLNQIEIYFSIVQRKVLTPNDFPSLAAIAERLANFERYYETIAHPFEWRFTRADLNALIARMRDRWARTQSWKLVA